MEEYEFRKSYLEYGEDYKLADKKAIRAYLECVKNIQSLNMLDAQLYMPKIMDRYYFHEQMCREIFGFIPSAEIEKYLKFKRITDNLDKICKIYSDADEWKLETSHDVFMMTKYLDKLLNSQECRNFINRSDVDRLICVDI